MATKNKTFWAVGPGFAKQLKPNSNLMHHRVKQFVFNELVADPSKKWEGTEFISLYARALVMCGTTSEDPNQRAERDFYDFAIPEGWIIEV